MPLAKQTDEYHQNTIDLPLPFGATLVQAVTGVTLTKVAPSTVGQGEILTYTLTFTNESEGPLDYSNGLVISDAAPVNTTINCPAPLPPSGWTPVGCNDSQVSWALVGIPTPINSGDSADFVFSVTVDDPLSDQADIVNDNYYVRDNTPAPYIYGPPVTTFVNAPRWTITKTVTSQTVSPGEYLTYSLTVVNEGALASSGTFTISDPLPNDIVPGSVRAPEAVDETASPLVWTFADSLEPAGVGTQVVTFTAQVTSPLANGTEIVNAGYTVFGGNAVNTAVNDPVTVTVDSPTTLDITKVASADPVLVGETLIYTITVTNNAAEGPAVDVVITDTLPGSVTYQSASGNGTPSGVSDIVWTLDSIPVSGSSAVTVAVTVDSAGDLENQFEASASNAPLVSDSITTDARLGITVITATNSSPNEVQTPTAFTVTTNLPAGVTYIWDFDDGGTGSGPNPDHTYTQVGTYTAVVTAENGVSSLSTTTVVTITPGPLAGFELQANSPQTAGASFPLSIRAVDVYSNTIADFNDSVDLSDSTGTISPVMATLTNGVTPLGFTISVTRATSPDVDTIMAEYNGGTISGTVGVEIKPDPTVDRIDLTLDPTSISLCGTTVATTTALDQFDNPIPEVSVFVGGLASGADVDPISDSGPTNESGIFVTTFQGVELGAAEIIAINLLGPGSDNATLTIAGSSAPSILSLNASPNPLQTGGNVAVVEATVRDCIGSMSGQEVNFTLSDLSLASFPGPSDTAVDSTNASGVATADVTSGDNPGTLTITGTVGALQEAIMLSILETVSFNTYLPIVVKE
jgi:uncharacterized repeat protein (TIGR01451 family)